MPHILICLTYFVCPPTRREISALEADNYSLERQLFSYQKSLAYTQSRGPGYADDSRSYTAENHPNYPEETPRSDYQGSAPDVRGNYFLRPSGADASGYQTPNLTYPSEQSAAEYQRPTTPSCYPPPDPSFQSASIYANGKRDYDTRDFPGSSGKTNFEGREFASSKKDADGRDFANPKREFDSRDYSPRGFAYDSYDGNFPNNSDYAWMGELNKSWCK